MEASVMADCTGAAMKDAIRFAEPLTAAMETFEINTSIRQSKFLATVSIESARLTALEEDLYYKDPARLARIFPRAFKSTSDAIPYTRNPKALGTLLYSGPYWGRGLIGLTWLKNYQAASDALGVDYVSDPDLLLQPEHAALTAAWFWQANGCNEAADAGDMKAVTRIVNGPALMHLAEREEQYHEALRVLA